MEWLNSPWLLETMGIGLLLLFAIYLEIILASRLAARFEKKKRHWSEALVRALHLPLLVTMILISVVAMAKEILSHYGDHRLSFYLDKAEQVTCIVAIIWFLVRLVARLEVNLHRFESRKFDKPTLYIISRVLRIMVGVIGFLIILPTIGIPMSGLLAFGGGGALVVGLASKDLLANFFGGLLIFLDRPFKIGDWISSPDREIEGTVEHIGWRLTCIRSLDMRPIYVPNSVFSSIAVQNISRMTHRRINTTIGLRYEDAGVIAPILLKVEQMLKSHPKIDNAQTIIVNVVEFGASSLNFLLYALTKTTNWVEFQKLQQEVLMKVFEIVAEHGAEIAFPVTTMNFEKPISVSLLQEKIL